MQKKKYYILLTSILCICSWQMNTVHAANDYASAYMETVDAYEAEHNGEKTEYMDFRPKYRLIHIDNDGIPELVAGADGYYVSVYTYKDGKVTQLMDDWGYGAFGNAGYYYLPKKNSVYNDNADQAGLIRYDTFLKINAKHSKLVTTDTYEYHYNEKTESYTEVNGREDMPSTGKYKIICGKKRYKKFMDYLRRLT